MRTHTIQLHLLEHTKEFLDLQKVVLTSFERYFRENSYEYAETHQELAILLTIKDNTQKRNIIRVIPTLLSKTERGFNINTNSPEIFNHLKRVVDTDLKGIVNVKSYK